MLICIGRYSSVSVHSRLLALQIVVLLHIIDTCKLNPLNAPINQKCQKNQIFSLNSLRIFSLRLSTSVQLVGLSSWGMFLHSSLNACFSISFRVLSRLVSISPFGPVNHLALYIAFRTTSTEVFLPLAMRMPEAGRSKLVSAVSSISRLSRSLFISSEH